MGNTVFTVPYNLPSLIEKQPTVGSDPQKMISGMMSNMIKKSDKRYGTGYGQGYGNGIHVRMTGKRQNDGNGVNVRMMGKLQDDGNGVSVRIMGKRQDDGKGGSNLMMRVGRVQNRDETDARGFYYTRGPIGRMAYPYVTQGFYYDE